MHLPFLSDALIHLPVLKAQTLADVGTADPGPGLIGGLLRLAGSVMKREIKSLLEIPSVLQHWGDNLSHLGQWVTGGAVSPTEPVSAAAEALDNFSKTAITQAGEPPAESIATAFSWKPLAQSVAAMGAIGASVWAGATAWSKGFFKGLKPVAGALPKQTNMGLNAPHSLPEPANPKGAVSPVHLSPSLTQMPI